MRDVYTGMNHGGCIYWDEPCGIFVLVIGAIWSHVHCGLRAVWAVGRGLYGLCGLYGLYGLCGLYGLNGSCGLYG